MFGATLKATNCSFQKGMTFCRSIYVKKVMKLLAFIFEQPSYFLSKAICKYLELLRLQNLYQIRTHDISDEPANPNRLTGYIHSSLT